MLITFERVTSDDRPVPAGDALLRALGWDDVRAAELAGAALDGAVPGRVVRAHRSAVEVLTADGPRTVRAVVNAHDASAPCVGDWLALQPIASRDDAPEEHVVLPRRTLLSRADASRSSEVQALAANVDVVGLVFSLAAPPKAASVERYLTLAWESGARPVVLLTKADVAAGDVDDLVAAVEASAPGADVIPLSSVTGDGLVEVGDALAGTVVLLGASGAGKSTLTNALLGAEVMATGEVRDSDGKGRHTTTTRELHLRPGGGVLIDTPGLRAVGLSGVDDGLRLAFADVEALVEDCRFRDCAHGSEPGCAVRAAIDDGRLEGGRLDRYRKLERENAWATSRTEAMAERDRVHKARSKQIRAMYALREERGHR
jgi:ribosome biogenesis GTPase